MGSFTWRAFALLVAIPALLLAWLGLRAVGAERLEVEQRLRDQQANVAQLVDAAIANTLADVARALPRDGVPPVGTPVVFAASGLVTFPRDRVYFGPFAQHPAERITAAAWSPAVAVLIEQAQTAEAQGRNDQAVRLLQQVQRAEPRLREWGDLAIARMNARRGSAGARARLSDSRWSESLHTSPSGLPIALIAAALSDEYSGDDRGAFVALIERTRAALRSGKWWLSAAERGFYDEELRRLLTAAHGGVLDAREPDRLVELTDIERVIRQSPPSRRDAPSYAVERGSGSGFLMVWSPYDAATQHWSGLAVPQEHASVLIEPPLARLVAGLPFQAAIRDAEGGAVSGSVLSAAWRAEPLQAVRGWEIVFTGPSESAALARRQWLWYGFIGVLLMVLFAGIGMTVQNARQKTELARMQSEFVGAVTHEFKSPITSIRLLLERIDAGRLMSPDAASAYAAAIGQEADRLERLVNRLLQAQQIDAGQQRHDFRPASLEAVTADAVRHVQALADSRNIRIELEAGGDVPAVVIDRAVMADAVENLLDNAVKYSPPGTRIRVRLHADDTRVSVDVEDEGIGIDADEIPRVFDKFYRARRGNLQNVRGTGLGLALVKAAADAHGGSVEVASEPGRGSRFSIRLPLPPQPARAS